MRITIDTRLLGRGARSGIEEYTETLIAHLLDYPHQFDLFHNGRQMTPLPDNFSRSNTRIINWGIPNKLIEGFMKITARPRIAGDVVFSPHFNFIQTQSPRIITFHDLSFLHHPDFFSNKQHLWHTIQMYADQARNANQIIAVSEFTKYDLINMLNIPAEKITVIYSGINPDFHPILATDPKLIEFSKKNNLDFPFMLYLGTIEPRKNINALITAFENILEDKNYKDFRLILAGSPGWLYSDILKKAKQSKFRDKIIFWGQVAQEDRKFLYNKCAAFAYPSFFEGFGFPPLEAEKCGAPVVASDRASLPEILGDSAILVNPWRADELSNALKIAVSDPFRESMRQKGFVNASKFNWRDSAHSTIKLIESVGGKI